MLSVIGIIKAHRVLLDIIERLAEQRMEELHGVEGEHAEWTWWYEQSTELKTQREALEELWKSLVGEAITLCKNCEYWTMFFEKDHRKVMYCSKIRDWHNREDDTTAMSGSNVSVYQNDQEPNSIWLLTGPEFGCVCGKETPS